MTDETKILDLVTITDLTAMGLGSRPTLARMIKEGAFPRPLPNWRRPQKWHRQDVLAWVESMRAFPATAKAAGDAARR